MTARGRDVVEVLVRLTDDALEHRQRGRHAQVVVHRPSKVRGQLGRRLGPAGDLGRPRDVALDALERGRRLRERLEAELDDRAVVGASR
jgi:hypothetical protein